MPRASLLILNSTNLHFPNRYDEALIQAGHPVERHENVDSFLASRLRREPFLALFEVGSTEDIERALIAYDWVDSVQPLAPARFLLLLASRNIELGERRRRFGAAEILTLPLPAKNLLFKIDLQLRLLQSEATKNPEGFFAVFEGEAKRPHETRVLVLRGPGPNRGAWKASGSTPEGKVRWRWVHLPQKQEEPLKIDLAWEAVSAKEPVFDEARKAWVVDDEKSDLRCFRQDKEVFSARRAAGDLPELELRERKIAAEAGGAGPRGKQEISGGGASTSQEARDPSPAFPAAPVAEASTAQPSPEETSAGRAEPEKEKGATRPASPGAPKAKAVLEEIRKAKEAKRNETPWNLPEQKRESKESFPYGTPSYAKEAPPASPKPKREVPGAEQARAPVRERVIPTEKIPEPREDGPDPGDHENPEVHSKLKPASGEPVPSLLPEKTKVFSEDDASAMSSQSVVSTPKFEGFDDTHVPSNPAPERELGHLSTESDPGRETNPASEGNPETARPAPNEAGGEQQEMGQDSVAPGETVAPPELPPEPASRPEPVSGTGGEEPPAALAMEAAALTATKEPKEKRAATAPEEQTLRKTMQHSEPKLRVPQHSEPASRIEIPPAASRQTPEWTVKGKTGTPQESVTVKAALPQAGTPGPSEGASLLASRLFLTMTLEELHDAESSWHPVDRYRIYLSARHRYYGVKSVDDFFPLWVYEGELAPEFLDKTRGWKFYDRLPQAYYSLQTVPAPIAAYLRKTAGLPEEEAETVAQLPPAPTAMGAKESAQSAPSPDKPGKTGALRAVWVAIRKMLGLE